MNLLTRHFHESRQVAFYADLLNVTPKHLNSIVLEQSGNSAKVAIDNYVVMQLKLALQTSDRSVKENRLAVQYFQSLYFLQVFQPSCRAHADGLPHTGVRQVMSRYLALGI